VEDLKQQLQSLKIDRDPPSSGRWKWVIWVILLVFVAAGFRYGLKYRADHSGTEVETVRPSIQTVSGPQPGAPLLAASGYVVAHKKAVVSAKIQGRLAELRVAANSDPKVKEVLNTFVLEPAIGFKETNALYQRELPIWIESARSLGLEPS